MVGVVAVGEFEASEAIPDQALQFNADAAPSRDSDDDGSVPLLALASVGIGVTVGMLSNGIVRSRRSARPRS
jgi:hypothetical protein